VWLLATWVVERGWRRARLDRMGILVAELGEVLGAGTMGRMTAIESRLVPDRPLCWRKNKCAFATDAGLQGKGEGVGNGSRTQYPVHIGSRSWKVDIVIAPKRPRPEPWGPDHRERCRRCATGVLLGGQEG
jgi:hypothetical protein